MHPVLFEIPVFRGIVIPTYGVLVALGFFAGMFWVRAESKRMGEDPEKALDLFFYAVIAAIVGSRILYVITADWDRFLSNPFVLFKLWEGGLVFYGGLIGALLVSVAFFRRHRLSALVYSDIFAPAIALGHAIGRWGCFFAGCCYGRVAAGHPWYAVVFPDVARSLAPPGVPLYPTQLMESAGELFIFGLLLLIRRKKKFHGQLIASYLMLYAILRAIIEYYRGDLIRGFVIDAWLSTSQFISIFIFFVGFIIFLRHRKALISPLVLLAGCLITFTGCGKPLLHAKVLSRVDYETRQFDASTNDIYYAVRDALRDAGYGVASENLQEGTITTTWRSTKADSHYVNVFDRHDYAPTGAYYQLEVGILPDDNKTLVKIGSRIKSIVSNVKSSGIEERKILAAVANFLRKREPTITNLGIEE